MKILLYNTALILFYFPLLQAQSYINIDSLRQILVEKHLPDSNRWNTLDVLATHYQEKSPDSALYFAEQLYQSAEANQDQDAMAKALQHRGDYNSRNGNYKEALGYYQSALDIWKSTEKQQGIASVWRRMGVNYYRQGKYDLALDKYQQSLELYKGLNDLAGISSVELNLGLFHLYRGEYAQALDLFQSSLESFNSLNKQSEMATALSNIGLVYYYQGEYEQAVQYYQQSLEIHKKLNNQLGIAKASGNLGLVHANQGNYVEALDYYELCQNNYEAIKDEQGIANNLTNIASIYYYQKDYDQSLVYNQRSLKVHEALKNQPGIAITLTNMGDSYLAKGNYTKATDTYQRSLKIYEALNNQLGIAYVLNNIGDIYQRQRKYPEALKLYLNSLDIRKSIADERGMSYVMTSIGSIYRELGKYEKARKYGEDALSAAKKVGSLDLTRNACDLLYYSYKSLGNPTKALQMYELHVQARDSLNNEENQRASIRFQFEQQALADSLANEQEKALAQLEYENQLSKQRLQLGFTGGVGLLLATLAIVLYRTNQRRRRTNQILSTQKEEIEVKSQQNELLLKEIHHRVKNNLETVSSLLELQSAQVEDSEIQSMMQASQSRVQSMSILHQKLYQGNNLAGIEMKDYFRNLVEGLLDTYDAWEQVEIEYDMQELELDVDTAIPIGLIVNELLTNTLKYAFPDREKGKVYLNLKQIDSKGLQLIVADNGVGTTTTATSKGTGFGSQLVSLLTRQLNGKMREKNEDGMQYVFEFEKNVWN